MAVAIVLILLDTLEASRFGWIAEWTYAFGPESSRAKPCQVAPVTGIFRGRDTDLTSLEVQVEVEGDLQGNAEAVS